MKILLLVTILTFFTCTTVANKTSEKSILLPTPNLLYCPPSELPKYSLPCRRQYVRNMTASAWSAYQKMTVYSATSDHQEVMLSFVSSLSVMNLNEEFRRARVWVRDELSFEQTSSRSLIGLVGHLMSAYALDKETAFLRKATEIARLLEPTFSDNILINRSHTFYDLTHPELTYLANILGPSSAFSAYVTEFQNNLKKLARPVFSMSEEGVGSSFIELFSNSKEGNESSTRLVDILRDFYYNLLRLYVQSDGHDVQSLEAYSLAINLYEWTSTGDHNNLFSRSPNGTYMYVKDEPGNNNNTSSSGISCSLGAMLALGQKAIQMEMVKLEKSSTKQTANSSLLEVSPRSDLVRKTFRNQTGRHQKLAEELISTCQQVAASTQTHLLPQSWFFSEADAITPQFPLSSLLTPDLAESLFTLYRLTGDQKYRDWAWNLVQSIEAHCRTPDGFYSAVEDVTSSSSTQTGKIPPTFFSGTLKYLYLIFCDVTTLPLHQWTFNQAGNPLPICGQSPMYSETLCRWHNRKRMHHY